MFEFNFVDALYIALLSVTVPVLVNRYLSGPRFSPLVRRWAMAGGILWMLYAAFSELIADSFMGVPWMDAWYHDYWARQLLEGINRGDWNRFWDHFQTGNHAYHCYITLLYYTGASIYTPTAINGWLAFWAGLILAYHFGAFCPFPKDRLFLLFWTVFCPSVLFWCTINLKESIMYWAVANVLAVSFVQKGKNYSAPRIVLTGVSILAGAMLRPHIVVGWILAVAGVNILQRGRRILAFGVLLCLPLVFVSMQRIVPVDTSQEAQEIAERHFQTLQRIKDQGSKIASEEDKPVFFFSGFVSAFFRPFPWEVRSVRTVAGSLEVWTMTLLIFFAWYNLKRPERRFILRLPMIRVALLGVLWMCVLLSYYPNEGLMLRQRVQMIPGLLALAVLPASVRSLARMKEESQKKALIAAYFKTPDSTPPRLRTPVRRPIRTT
jgi:hypothetical protein